ncbi:MAG TPA: nitronate monooxygenase [Actinomycetales bacterium]|nr:nitronate monooxygenase [Actinomycetales bacterium]
MRTHLTERWQLDVPVVGAPMAGAGGGALAAAVSSAGALGMLGVAADATADWVREQCSVAAEPGRPYGVGLMAWALERDPAPLAAVLAARPTLVSVSFGPYERYVEQMQAEGIAVATQVGTVTEAVAATRAGVDLVVSRGGEGGGHGRNDVSTLVLLQAVLDEVATPVLAAGGIATARGLAAVLAAGAAGGWVGTAFLGCAESSTSAAARDRLLAASETDTAYGRVFDVAQRLGWPPEYGGRALRNAFFDRWQGREGELAGDDAAAAELAAARTSHDLDTAYVYAGQGAGLLTSQRTAADIVADLAGAAELLRRAAT